MDTPAVVAAAMLLVASAAPARAAGHGPVFGATTPTLGRGGWSLDEAWTLRDGDADREQMLKAMISYGITERLQVSGSFPLAMNSGALPPARTMSLMSNEREVEGIAAYRFQARTVGIGGRQESTVYGGATSRGALEVAAATGYASRAHYVWVGGGLEREPPGTADSRLATFVYGYRPAPLRTEANRPDVRFFVEATAEDRPDVSQTLFVGPTTLVLYRAVGIEGGVLFPAYEHVAAGGVRERVRLAVDVAYFFWLN